MSVNGITLIDVGIAEACLTVIGIIIAALWSIKNEKSPFIIFISWIPVLMVIPTVFFLLYLLQM